MWMDDGMLFMKTFNKSEFSREDPKKFKRILNTVYSSCLPVAIAVTVTLRATKEYTLLS